MHTLIYYAEKEQMLVVSASCTLNILGKDEQLGTWMSLSKMKFATGTGEAASGLQVGGRACIHVSVLSTPCRRLTKLMQTCVVRSASVGANTIPASSAVHRGQASRKCAGAWHQGRCTSVSWSCLCMLAWACSAPCRPVSDIIMLPLTVAPGRVGGQPHARLGVREGQHGAHVQL